MTSTVRKILSAALAIVVVVIILGLLTAIWLPGMVVRQAPPNQQISSP